MPVRHKYVVCGTLSCRSCRSSYRGADSLYDI